MAPVRKILHSNLGNAFKEQRCLEEAVTSYQTAPDIQPDYAEVYYNLGSVLSELKRFNEAVSCFYNSIRIKPNFAEAHSSLGMTLQKLDGKFKEVEFKKFDYFIPTHFPTNWQIRFGIYVNTPSFVARLRFKCLNIRRANLKIIANVRGCKSDHLIGIALK